MGLIINPVLFSDVNNLNSDEFIAFHAIVSTDIFENDFNQILINELSSWISPAFHQYYNEINNLFDQYNGQVLSQYYVNMIVLVPYIFIGIFLINYSFNLVSANVEQILRIFKIRGISKRLLASLLISESLINLFFSIVISIPISYILAYVGLQVNGFNSYSIGTFPLYRINNIVIPTLVLYSFFIFILNTIPRILTLLKINYLEHGSIIEKKEPFWKRHFIDIWLILSSVGIISLYFLLTFIISNPQELMIYTNLVIIFPFILLI